MDLGHHTQVTRTLIAGVGRKIWTFQSLPNFKNVLETFQGYPWTNMSQNQPKNDNENAVEGSLPSHSVWLIIFKVATTGFWNTDMHCDLQGFGLHSPVEQGM